jgi:hypothetical protein
MVKAKNSQKFVLTNTLFSCADIQSDLITTMTHSTHKQNYRDFVDKLNY